MSDFSNNSIPKSNTPFGLLLILVFGVLHTITTVFLAKRDTGSPSDTKGNNGGGYEICHLLLLAEVLKFVLSCFMEYVTACTSRTCCCSGEEIYQSIKTYIIEMSSWKNCGQVSLLAILYYGQNYVILMPSLAFISAPLFQVMFQCWKLLVTTILSVRLLRRKLKLHQWVCNGALSIGVSVLLANDHMSLLSSSSSTTSTTGSVVSLPRTHYGLFMAMFVCLCGAVADVSFEKVISQEKTGGKVSVWMRQMQLVWFSMPIAIVHSLISSLSSKPFLHGFTPWVWLQVLLLAMNGLFVAAMLKYTSATTKALVASISVLLWVLVASVIWGSPPLTLDLVAAAAICFFGIYAFRKPNQTTNFFLVLVFCLAARSINFHTRNVWDFFLHVETTNSLLVSKDNGATSDCLPVEPDDWTLPGYHTRPMQSTSDLRPMFPAIFGTNYRPSLHRRSSDGHPFLLLLMVQQPEWLGMAVNFILSLRKLGIYNVTITSRDDDVLETATALGLVTFNSTEVSKQMPEWIQPLPSWTWGVDMWQRYVTSWHAIRQGIGTCHFDVDTAISTDIFFDPPGGPYDITIQGHLLDPTMRPVPLKPEQYLKMCNLQYQIHGSANYEQFYMNQGFACYAANERTFQFFRAWDKANKEALQTKTFGWLQPASNKAFCEGDFRIFNTHSPDLLITNSTRYGNMSTLVFRAFPDSDSDKWTSSQIPPAVHPKGCNGKRMKEMRNISWRVECKIDVLKSTGFWHIPFHVPFEGAKWKDPDLVSRLRNLLITNTTEIPRKNK